MLKLKHVDEFIKFMESNRCSPETVASYTSTIRKYVDSYNLINDATVEEFIKTGYTNPATRNKVLGQLKSFAKWGVAKKYAGFDLVTIRKFAKPRTIPITIEDTNTDKFLKALERIDKQAWSVAMMMKATGMRIGEVMKLDKPHLVEPQPGIMALKFFGKGNQERIVPLTKDALVAARCWLDLTKRSRWSVRTIRRRFVEAERRARISHLKPHWFRHTIATKLVNKGHSYDQISHLLGNTSEVCQQVYGSVNTTNLSRLVEDALKA